jgi:hypothetical protein
MASIRSGLQADRRYVCITQVIQEPKAGMGMNKVDKSNNKDLSENLIMKLSGHKVHFAAFTIFKRSGK